MSKVGGSGEKRKGLHCPVLCWGLCAELELSWVLCSVLFGC